MGWSTSNFGMFSVSVACLATALALSACGNDGSAPPEPPTTPTPPFPPPPPPPPPTSRFDTSEFRASTGLAQIDMLAAYDAGATGRNVTVGIVDSGLDPSNAEFAGRISTLASAFLNGAALDDPVGHGTSFASVVAGAKNDVGSHGVAFDAIVAPFKIIPPICGNTCSPSDPDFLRATADTVRAIDFAVSNNVRILAFAIEAPALPPSVRDALVRAAQAGTVLVIAAGNGGGANPSLLAQIVNDPGIPVGRAVAVGSVDAQNAISASSDRASNAASAYMVAPGENILLARVGGTFSAGSGTSWSAAMVAGAVAVVMQQLPNLTAPQALDRLLRSATDLGQTGTDPVYGRGLLNVAAAIQLPG